MAEAPKTLPANFFDGQPPPKTLPANFFQESLPARPDLTSQNAKIDQMLAQNPQHQSYGFTVGNILQNALEGAKSLASGTYTLGKDIVQNPNWVTGPNSTLQKFVVNPSEEQTIQAGQAFNQGQTLPAIGHAVASAIPFIGPWAASLGQQAGTGDIGGAVGQAAGTALAAEVGGRLTGAPAAAGEAIEKAKLAGKTPEGAVINALNRGGLSKVKMDPVEVAKVLPDIKRVAPDAVKIDPNAPDVERLSKGAQKAKEAIWSEYIQKVGRNGNYLVDGSPIADQMMKSIPQDVVLKASFGDKSAIAAIKNVKEEADLYRRAIPISDLEELRKGATADLSSYYRKSERGQYEARASNIPVGVRNAEAQALRGALDGALQTHEEAGLPGAELRRKYGTLTKISDAAQRQELRYGAKAPINMPTTLGTLGAGMEAITALGYGHPFAALGAVVPYAVGRAISYLNDPEVLVRHAMQQVTASPYPETPMTIPQKALPRGPIMPPPPADESFVRGVPAMLQAPAAVRFGRLLPEGEGLGPLQVPYRGEPAGSEPTRPGPLKDYYSAKPQPKIEKSRTYSGIKEAKEEIRKKRGR